jgi:membrane-associated phospholipid phosphatase
MNFTRTKIFSFLFLFIFVPASHPQIIDDIKDFFNTGKDILYSPSQFNDKDILTISAVLWATATSFTVDNSVKDFAAQNHNKFNDKLFNIDKYYGSGYTFGAAGGIYLYGLAFCNSDVRLLGLRLGEACGYAGIITTILKYAIGRSRPYVNAGNLNFKPFRYNDDNWSLPSGHATEAFAFSTVMANELDNFFWKFGWYTASTLVCAARVYHNQHWFSDVVLGSAIGYFTGDFVCSRNKDNIQAAASSDRFIVSYKLNF